VIEVWETDVDNHLAGEHALQTFQERILSPRVQTVVVETGLTG